MQIDLSDIDSWATAEAKDLADSSTRKSTLNALRNQIALDRKLPQPLGLPPASSARQIAEARQRRIGHLAEILGYQPPLKEIVTEAAKHVALAHLPAPELAKIAIESGGSISSDSDSKSQQQPPKKSKKRRSPGIGDDDGLGLGFSF